MSTRLPRLTLRTLVAAMTVLIGSSVGSGSMSPAAVSFDAAAARTYVVNSTADRPDTDVATAACSDSHHRCTLRAAVMEANYHPGADTIKVPKGTYTLTRKGRDDGAIVGDLDITDSVTILGAGSSTTIVDGNGSVTLDRVFQVLPSATNVTIAGLTIRNGARTIDTFDSGGGLSWQGADSTGHLSLRNLVIERNHAKYGGGLALESGYADVIDLNGVTVRGNVVTAAAGGVEIALADSTSFTLRNSRIHGNVAYQGAGIDISGGTSSLGAPAVVIRGTTIDANHATGIAGGIENYSGQPGHPVVVADSEIDGNVGYEGGGIENHGVMTLAGVTLASNRATSKGGAFAADSGSATDFTNVTIDGNAAADGGAGIYAAVFLAAYPTIALSSVTMSHNTSTTYGAAIYLDPGALVSVTDTLIAKGSTGTNCSPSVGGLGNLSDDSSCGFGAGDGIADLKLGPLGDHGGPTRTRLLLAGSPAIDAGPSLGGPATDQRGFVRPQGLADDTGAVEMCQTAPAAPSLLAPRNGKVSKVRTVTLDWGDVPCAQTYVVVIRHGSKTGRLVTVIRGLHPSTYRTVTPHHGWTYYWQIRAVGDAGTTNSAWRRFHVK